MGIEIDLLKNYPKSKRNLDGRAESKTPEQQAIAREFGKQFFDGNRNVGYGGFNYHPRFWQPVIPDFQDFYQLTEQSSVLDVGSAKGFMLYDLQCLIPGIQVAGVDISEYAIESSKEEVRANQQVACASELPFDNNSFDLVISVNTVHNLEREKCAKALLEIQRVSKGKCFITVDAYRNEEERQRMHAWNLTAKTIMHVDEWKRFFQKIGYQGDYYWFIP